MKSSVLARPRQQRSDCYDGVERSGAPLYHCSGRRALQVEGAVALRSACLSVFAACGLMIMAAPSKAQDPQAGGTSAAPPAAAAPSPPAVAAPAAPAPVPPVLIPVQ